MSLGFGAGDDGTGGIGVPVGKVREWFDDWIWVGGCERSASRNYYRGAAECAEKAFGELPMWLGFGAGEDGTGEVGYLSGKFASGLMTGFGSVAASHQ